MTCDVTAIIVTWNNRNDLPACLASLARASVERRCETIVVDNQSADGTAAYVESAHPEIRLLVNGENLGFAAANNRALRLARSPFILLLNPDTRLEDGAVDRLVRCLEGRPGAWVAGPTVLNGDGSPQRTGVTFPSTWNILAETLFLDRLFPLSPLFGGHRRLYDDPSRMREVDYVQGSCLLVRREALAQAGVLDEDYFMYFEETDWCYRMRRAGGTVVICPEARVVHYGGGDMLHYDAWRLVHYHRSLLTFYRKHRTPVGGIVLRGVLMLRSLHRMLLWTAVAVLSRARRTRALSSARGYFRTVGLLFRGRP